MGAVASAIDSFPVSSSTHLKQTSSCAVICVAAPRLNPGDFVWATTRMTLLEFNYILWLVEIPEIKKNTNMFDLIK